MFSFPLTKQQWMSSNIYITPSTTLVLLKNLSRVVYLSSLQAPNFSVTIRDTTGRVSIRQTPIAISTIGGALFEDGTNLYTLDQPYGLVNLSLYNSSIWRVQHTSGQKPATAAATVTTVSAITSYFTFLSSIKKVISTLYVQDIRITNPILFTGNTVLSGISTTGGVLLEGPVVSYGTMAVTGALDVKGNVSFLSTLNTRSFSTLQQPITIYSTLSSGGSMYVGGTTFVSSLQLVSTVQIQTLQVKGSTSVTSIQGFSLLGGLLSTFGNVATQTDMTVQRKLLSGTLSTQGSLYGGANVTVQASSIFLSTTTVNYVSLLSTTVFLSSLSLNSSLQAYSTVSFYGSTVTASFTSPSVYSFGNLQLQGQVTLSNSATVTQASTLFLQGPSSLSIIGNFVSLSSISTISLFSANDVARIQGSATFAGLSIGKDLVIGGSTFIGSSISTGSGLLSMDLTLLSSMEVKGSATFNSNVNVSSATVINGQLAVAKDTTIIGLYGKPFFFDTLTATSFVSTPLLNVSSLLSTGYLYITNSNYCINTSTFYTSTLTTSQLSIVSSLITQTATANTFFLGPSSFDLLQNPYNFLISSSTYFVQGLSSVFLSTGTVNVSSLYGAFFGNAIGVSNITVVIPDNTSSFTTFITTSLSTINLNTSSFTLQGLQTSSLTIFSSLNTNLFQINTPGTPIQSTVHQFVNTTTSNLVINNILYLNNKSTVLVSPIFRGPAAYDLDISGVLYTSSLFYSSIQSIDVNQTSNTSVTGFTSSIVIRDLLQTQNLEFFLARTASTFLIENAGRVNSNAFDSITATPSSLVIRNQLYIHNELFSTSATQRVIVDTTQANFTTTTTISSLLMVYGTILTSTIKTSTLTIGIQLSTPSLFFSTLGFYNGNTYQESIARNSFQSYNTTLAINSTLFLHKTYGVLAINTLPDPSTFMRVSSNAFFSTLVAPDLRAGTISYSFQTL